MMQAGMDREQDRLRLFTRRGLLIGGLQAGIMAGLLGRLFYLQIIEGTRYELLAEENRISLRLLAPPRGMITDRNGERLAFNQPNYRLILTPEATPDIKKALHRISQLLPLTEEDIDRLLRDAKKRRKFIPLTVQDNLNWSQVAAIEVNSPDLTGLAVEMGQSRFYPYGEAAAHLLGYVATPSEADTKADDDALLTLPGFKIGREGIEREFDQRLRGTAGNVQIEVNAVGRAIRELQRSDGQPGEDIRLTLHAGLQQKLYQRLSQERSAAAVVMDVHDGSIYGLGSFPSYDPNQFSSGISTELWDELSNNPAHPLTNKAIAGQYPPGSTFKMITALAALHYGVISESHQVFCPGHYELGNHRFHCWKRGGHGTVGMLHAIAESCDTFFYDVARKVGVDKIAEVGRWFGLGEKTDIEIPGERAGLMPTRAWRQRRFGSPWLQGETLVAGIGQGYVLTTPLQLAVMTARMVNGGRQVVPHLGFNQPNSIANIPIAPKWLRLMKDSMDAVTNAPFGTAARSQLANPAFAMGGKTGTAQVRRITMAQRAEGLLSQDQLPWKYRHHALFVGYAPIAQPRYAVAVIVEHGGSGSGAAAPLARDILQLTQEIHPAAPLPGASP